MLLPYLAPGVWWRWVKQDGVVLRHEMGRINARPPLVGMGLSMMGRLACMERTQKEEHLPKMARAIFGGARATVNRVQDRILPSTSAVEDDDFIINGKRSGRQVQIMPTGCFAWCVRTLMHRSMRAFPSCFSI